jgi:hypothetical protein
VAVTGQVVEKIILIGEDKASKAIEDVTKRLDKMGKEAKEAERGFLGLRKGAVEFTAKGLAAATAIGHIAEAMEEYVKQGAAFTAQTEAMNAQIEDFDEQMTAARDASQGLISDRALTQAAAQFKGLGVPMEEFARVAELVAKTSVTTGRSTEFLFERLAVGVGRLSPQRLDELNIVITEQNKLLEDHARALGKTAKELTGTEIRTKILTESIDQMAQKTAGVDLSSASQNINKLAVSMENADTATQSFIAGAANDIIGWFSDTEENSSRAAKAVRLLGLEFKELGETAEEAATKTLLAARKATLASIAELEGRIAGGEDTPEMRARLANLLQVRREQFGGRTAGREIGEQKAQQKLLEDQIAGHTALALAMRDNAKALEALDKLEQDAIGTQRERTRLLEERAMLANAQRETERRSRSRPGKKRDTRDATLEVATAINDAILAEQQVFADAMAAADQAIFDQLEADADRVITAQEAQRDREMEILQERADNWLQFADDLRETAAVIGEAFSSDAFDTAEIDFRRLDDVINSMANGLERVTESQLEYDLAVQQFGKDSKQATKANDDLSASYIDAATATGTAVASMIKDETARAAVMAAIHAAQGIAFIIAEDYPKAAMSFAAAAAFGVAAGMSGARTGGARGTGGGGAAGIARRRNERREGEGTTTFVFNPGSLLEAALSQEELAARATGTDRGG